MLVTIIIPVYKTEKYLEVCIESALHQTYKNIEILIIDDGSPDFAPILCDRYGKRDQRVKVIHKKNGGLSDARNTGIKYSNGEYILFLDSDDYIELNAVELLVKKVIEKKLDVIEFNANRLVCGSASVMHGVGMKEIENKVVEGVDYYLFCVKNDFFLSAACFKFIKRKIIIDNNIMFKVGRLHEDELWSPQLLIVSKKVMYLNLVLYNYVIHEESITNSKNMTNNVMHYMKNCLELETIFRMLNIDKSKKKRMCDYLARQYMSAISMRDYDKIIINRDINRLFPVKNAFRISTFCLSIMYFFSPYLYLFIKKKWESRKCPRKLI